MDYDLVILGGSLAARFAAQQAIRLKKRVALVEPSTVAAEVAHHTLLHVGRTLKQQAWAAASGLLATSSSVSDDLWQTIAAWGSDLAASETLGLTLPQLAAAGVDVVQGQGSFSQLVSRSRRHQYQLALTAADRQLLGKAYLLLPSAQPTIPDIAGLSDISYRTLTNLWQNPWRSLPPRLLIVGGDPKSIELAQAMQRLGVQVVLIVTSDRLLPYEDPSAATLLQIVLETEGVQILTQTRVQQVKRIDGKVWVQVGDQAGVTQTPRILEAEAIVLAIGQRPDLASLNLEAAGIDSAQYGVPVNRRLQSRHPQIYAAGNALGGSPLLHLSQYEASIALHNLFSIFPKRVQVDRVPWVLYTDPAFARVGLSETAARRRFGQEIRVVQQPFRSLAAQIAEETVGFCQLIAKRNGELVGAQIVGPQAAELINPIALVIQQRLKLESIAQLPISLATFTEELRHTAQS